MAVNQKNAIRVLTLGAMMTALGVVCLYLSSMLPTMRLSLVALAGLLPCVMVMAGGIPSGFAAYGATAVLAFLIVPNKSAALLYLVVFGHYPMIKSLAERVGNRVLEWTIKLGTFNVALTIIVLFARAIFSEIFGAEWAIWVIYLGGNAIFLLYDFAFSGLILVFNSKFGKLLRKGR